MAVRAFVLLFLMNNSALSIARTHMRSLARFRSQPRSRIAVAALACLASGAALAQTELRETVVTASRSEQAAQDALPSTTLITRADLDRAQTTDLPSVLRNVAGIEITQTGGMGGVTTAFIRGAESRHTLVLVDGVPINNLNFGLASLENLPLANVDHIEIVRGNVSALYGSSALGGVIQIFTREGTAQPQLSLSTQISSRGLRQASASGSVKLASGTSISATLETINDLGINATNQTELPGTNPDRDGYTRQAFSTSVRQDVAGGSIGLKLRNAQGNLNYDSQYGPATQADVSQYVERGAVLDGKFKLRPDLDVTASLSTSADKLNSSVTAYPYFVNSLSNGASLGLQWQAARGQRITAGAETTHQSIQSDTIYNASSRTQKSLRLGYSGQFGAAAEHELQLNVRTDSYTTFGSASTGFAGYAYRLSSAWRINASYSTGFNAPTFNDLYYPYGGNPNLVPERLKSAELGVQYLANGQELRSVWFDNRYSNLIGNDANYNRVNINSALNKGLETTYKAHFGSLGVNADLTLQAPTNLADGSQLARRAKTLAHLGLTQDVGVWNLGGQLGYTGSAPDGATSKVLAAYTLMGVSVSRLVSPGVTAFGRIDNLLNAQYETAYGYNQPGRTLFVGLRWQPKL